MSAYYSCSMRIVPALALTLAGVLGAPFDLPAQAPPSPQGATRDRLRDAARDSAGRDTVRADSARARSIAAVRVEATRSAEPLRRLPWALSVLDTATLRRARATLGIDEALANVPGVVVSNRYNFALDQRLSIRGAGSRANFGLRGVKVLLDGIPQSLPDGQSQLTNIDLAAVDRVEVLRGAASSLHGNGSGGVVAFSSDLGARDPLGASMRWTQGSYGFAKGQARVSGRAGSAIGALSASITNFDGFRQHSVAGFHQVMGAVDQALPGGVTMSYRAGLADTPQAQNPGALTPAEYAANPDSAAANNVRRGASRIVSQRYLSVRAHRASDAGEWSAALFGQRRFVDNPLATAPPNPAGPESGIRSTIDRRVTGLRLDGSRTFAGAWMPTLALGLDLQRSHDVRTNQQNTAGVIIAPSDTVYLRQAETVTSLGPSAQLRLAPSPAWLLSVGGRWDRLAFRVEDRFLGDGDDDSGDRVMTAGSGHVGVTWLAGDRFTPYANVATAFETPTTTELNARQDGLGGFNDVLGPQRIASAEVGARGRWWRLEYEAAVFESRTRDAIVQYLESGGRAYFRNAGRTRSRGAELGVQVALASWLRAQGTWTRADHRFLAYRIPSAVNPAPALDTLDGRAMAGIPGHTWRGVVTASGRGFALDVEQTSQGRAWGDDRNTVRVPAWGPGQLNVRAAWRGRVGAWRVEPFAAWQNLLDRRYVGSITLNGFGGRVLEPAPGRNWYAGVEVAVPIVR